MLQQQQSQPQQQQQEQSEFVKIDNKGRLWKILQDNGGFNGIENNFFSKVREEFEIMIVRIDEDHRDKVLMEKCKLFIDAMLTKMAMYKFQTRNNTAEPPYTAEAIKTTRITEFGDELSKKQEDFNKYSAKPTKPDVNFSDDADDMKSDVNELLEKALRDRADLSIPPPIPKTKISNTTHTALAPNNTALDPTAPATVLMDDITTTGKQTTPVPNEILQQILAKLEVIEAFILKSEHQYKA
jgi:hypothetical protein